MDAEKEKLRDAAQKQFDAAKKKLKNAVNDSRNAVCVARNAMLREQMTLCLTNWRAKTRVINFSPL